MVDFLSECFIISAYHLLPGFWPGRPKYNGSKRIRIQTDPDPKHCIISPCTVGSTQSNGCTSIAETIKGSEYTIHIHVRQSTNHLSP